MKKKFLLLALGLCVVSQASFAAKLCGRISNETGWDGGVFSVVAEDGQTIATTAFVLKGGQGCTESFSPGTYFIRFNGAKGETFQASNEIYGCVTGAAYKFDDTVLNIVFNQGSPPFNSNSYCNPTT